MRTILLHADQEAGFENRLRAALDLTERFNGHLRLLIATPFQQFVSFDPFGGSYFAAEVLAKAQAEDAALEHALEQRMAGENVHWDIRRANGDIVGSLAGAAALVDLAIVSLADDESRSTIPDTLAGDLAIAAPIAVLGLPRAPCQFSANGPVLVAWNGDAHAANVLRRLMPLLDQHSHVKLLTVGDIKGEHSATDALLYLQQHGFPAEHRHHDADERRVAEVITAEAEALGARLIAMGAFGHSRLRQTFFGGVTQYFLSHSHRPLLLAH